MEFKKIDHIGIAVRDLERSLSRWLVLFRVKTSRVEEIEDRGVRLVHLYFPEGPAVELISPLGEESPIAKFLDERGEGIHHLTIEVDDIESAMKELKSAGLQFVADNPQKGASGSRIAFIHPRSLDGILIELKEEKRRNAGSTTQS